MNSGVFTILIYYTISRKQFDACTCNKLRKITMFNDNNDNNNNNNNIKQIKQIVQ